MGTNAAIFTGTPKTLDPSHQQPSTDPFLCGIHPMTDPGGRTGIFSPKEPPNTTGIFPKGGRKP